MKKFIFAGILAATSAHGFTLISPPVHTGDAQFMRCSVVVTRPSATVAVDVITGDGRNGTDFRSNGYRFDTGERIEWAAGSLPSTDARTCVVVVSGATTRDVKASVEVREGAKLVAVVGF